jgi:hypothetical protein
MEYPVLPPLPFRRYPDETLQTVYPRDRGLSPSQIALLEEIYYEDGHHFGAVKLFDILRELYTERQAVEKIYLKQLTRWLYAQETHQLNKQRPKQIGNKPFRVNSPRSVLGISRKQLMLILKECLEYLNLPKDDEAPEHHSGEFWLINLNTIKNHHEGGRNTPVKFFESDEELLGLV